MRASGRKWLAGIVAVTLVALLAGWIAAHARNRRLPPPLWTAADLPALPAVADDGWALLPPPGRRVAMDTAQSELCVPSGHSTFADVLDQQMELRAAVAAPAAVPDLLLAAAVFGRPRLTDRCALGALAECAEFDLRKLHRVAVIDILTLALDGEWDRALARATELVRGDADFLGHTRGLLPTMVGLKNAREAVALVGLLVDGLEHPPDGPAAPPARVVLAAGLTAVAQALATVRAADVDPREVVVAEYVRRRAELDLVVAQPGAIGAPSAEAALFFDARMTMMALDDYQRELYRYAGDTTGPAPPPPQTHVQGLAWKLWNPVGRTLVELQLDAAPALRRVDTEHAHLVREADALGPRLAALAAPAP